MRAAQPYQPASPCSGCHTPHDGCAPAAALPGACKRAEAWRCSSSCCRCAVQSGLRRRRLPRQQLPTPVLVVLTLLLQHTLVLAGTQACTWLLLLLLLLLLPLPHRLWEPGDQNALNILGVRCQAAHQHGHGSWQPVLHRSLPLPLLSRLLLACLSLLVVLGAQVPLRLPLRPWQPSRDRDWCPDRRPWSAAPFPPPSACPASAGAPLRMTAARPQCPLAAASQSAGIHRWFMGAGRGEGGGGGGGRRRWRLRRVDVIG